MYKHVVKRLFDLVFSVAAMIVLLLPMVTIAIAIVIDDPGPVFFRQKRAWKKQNGKKSDFIIWKFRSMKAETPCDMPTGLLENPEQYVTRVGKILRVTGLDELPQIYQVFLGRLSLVGPRPVLRAESDLLEEREKYGANDVLPGIIGWAQVNGRDTINFEQKAKLDGEYASVLKAGGFRAFWMDVRCIMKTFGCVLRSIHAEKNKDEKNESHQDPGA